MNYYVGGLSPFGYHVVNIVLHSTVTVLYMLACRQVAPRHYKVEPVLAAAIFAVHPVHVEAVRTRELTVVVIVNYSIITKVVLMYLLQK